MILLALALHVATAAQPQARPRIHPVRAHVTRRKARRHAGTVRAMHLNVVPTARVDPNAQYRLPLRTTEISDSKDRAVRSAGTPCGLTGAPVCPSKGMTIVDAPIDNPKN